MGGYKVPLYPQVQLANYKNQKVAIKQYKNDLQKTQNMTDSVKAVPVDTSA